MEKKEEKKEKPIVDAGMFKGLRTMIPADVYDELTELAKENATFTGAWDYGNVLRELLWIRKVFFNFIFTNLLCFCQVFLKQISSFKSVGIQSCVQMKI